MARNQTVNQRRLTMNKTMSFVLGMLLPLFLFLPGCVPPPSRQPSAPIVLDQVSEGIILLRHGRSLAIWPGIPLEIGDEIETDADSRTVIHFYPAGHEVRLMPNTRVQIHSIFAFFGEIFVKAKGFFKVENEFVELDVEGTEFWFRVSRDQTVTINVNTGSVRCRSKLNRWETFPVRSGEEYVIPPNKAPIPVKQIPPEPEQGGCCVEGRVFQGDRSLCARRGGRYFNSAADARRACEPTDTSGWCCVNGNLNRDSASGCKKRRGQFFNSESEARHACRPPDPYGWCCVNGKLSRNSASECRKQKGRFFDSNHESDAKRYCVDLR